MSYSGDGFSSGMALSFYQDPNILETGAGLYVYRAEDEYLGMKYLFRDPTDEDPETIVSAIVSAPVAPNGLYFFGEFSHSSQSGLAAPIWGIYENPFLKSELQLKQWIQVELDGSVEAGWGGRFNF